MSTSKRYGRLSKPILKGSRASDLAALRRSFQKRRAQWASVSLLRKWQAQPVLKPQPLFSLGGCGT